MPSPDQICDVVDRGMVSLDKVSDLVDVWKKDIMQYFPGAATPLNCSASNQRQTKPVIFLATITAASLPGNLPLIADDTFISFGFDDPSANIGLADLQLQGILKAF